MAGSRTLPFPAETHAEAAVLGDWTCFDAVVCHPENRWRDLAAAGTGILAGKFADLAQFGAAAVAFHNAPVRTGLLALTETGDEPLLPQQRILLWRLFRVPLYEVLVHRELGVLASECEARGGWHIRHRELRFNLESGQMMLCAGTPAAAAIPTGLFALGLDGLCPCGDYAPLLKAVCRPAKRPQRTRAAIA